MTRLPLRRLRRLFVSCSSALGLALGAHTLMAQTLARVEPPSWWTGMQDRHLQLMLHGSQLSGLQARLQHAGVRLLRQQAVTSPNYLFLDLDIAPDAPPGPVHIELLREGKAVLQTEFALQAREPGSAQRQGFGPKDAIYLVVPDRFAQAGPDLGAAGMLEGVHRDQPGGRHGGNIAGLRQHLGYIADMGFTMLWPTPLIENNAAAYSYHGYGATDFYRIDPRFGSNEDYRQLVADARRHGLGVIQDMVLNHIGIQHAWMKDLPTPDWVNTWPQYTETNHARLTLQDLYAADSDRRRYSEGWFSPGMPDLNQRQPLLATYLIQQSLWWIEYAGLSGVRTDTYSYSDKAFLSQWSERLMREYPRLNIVGEEWTPYPAIVSYWQRGKHNHDGYQSSSPSMMDFPLHGALLAALQEGDGHDSGLMRLYEMLGQDFLYADPAQLVLFEGNHDTPRIFSALGEDTALYKMAVAYLAVTRRIPQFFYGSELLMTSPRQRDDGAVRADFPGGWSGDKVNGFTGAGLSAEQRDAQQTLRRLLQWRRGNRTVHEGRLMHYSPSHGVYALFRYGGQQRVALFLNKNSEAVPLAPARYPEMLRPGEQALDVLSGRPLTVDEHTMLPPRSALVLQLDGAAPTR